LIPFSSISSFNRVLYKLIKPHCFRLHYTINRVTLILLKSFLMKREESSNH
jgi:hypothetical protein